MNAAEYFCKPLSNGKTPIVTRNSKIYRYNNSEENFARDLRLVSGTRTSSTESQNRFQLEMPVVEINDGFLSTSIGCVLLHMALSTLNCPAISTLHMPELIYVFRIGATLDFSIRIRQCEWIYPIIDDGFSGDTLSSL